MGLVLLLLMISAASAISISFAATGYDSELNKNIVVKHLNNANSFIIHAQRILHETPENEQTIDDPAVCSHVYFRMLNLVRDAKEDSYYNNWDSAKARLENALAQNTRCIHNLRENESPIARSIAFVSGEIEEHLRGAANELEIVMSDAEPFETLLEGSLETVLGVDMENSSALSAEAFMEEESVDEELPFDHHDHDVPVETTARTGCSRSHVDGTKCQFSECGKDGGLVSCAVGFARGVKGGLRGIRYVVTTDVDNALHPVPGSLRYGTNLAGRRSGSSGGVWITFAHNMTIVLTDMLWVRSRTTIDGRGVNATLVGHTVVLGGVHDVIIHNIQISNVPNADTLHIFSGSNKIWVDHVTSFNGQLGLASVLQGSSNVTISNCDLQNDNFNMLLGASDADSEDKEMRVTVYRNWFHDSMQRMPHCRWGICHVINNLYTNWGYYAIGARANARVRSESNVFISHRVKEVTPWFPSKPATFDMSSRIESHNDVLMNGTTFHQFLLANVDVTPPYSSSGSPPILSTSSLPSLVQACSGAIFGSNLLRCQQA